MKEYVTPSAELVSFADDDIMTSQTTSSKTCRCYLDIGVKFDYNDPASGCWSDSEDASAYDMHDAPIG